MTFSMFIALTFSFIEDCHYASKVEKIWRE